MNTHCLFCKKRLGFFHNKKKPYCSDVHEDRYLEQQATSALGRLKDDPEAPIRTLEEIFPEPFELELPDRAYSYPPVEDLDLDEESDSDPEPSAGDFALDRKFRPIESTQPAIPRSGGFVSQIPDLRPIGDPSGSPVKVRVTLEEVRDPSPVAQFSLSGAGLTLEAIEPPPFEPQILPAFKLRPSAQPGMVAAVQGALSLDASRPMPQIAESGSSPALIDPPALAPEVWPLMPLESRALSLEEPPPMSAFRAGEVDLCLPQLGAAPPVRRIAVATTIAPQPQLGVPQPLPLEESISVAAPVYYRIRRQMRLPSFAAQPAKKLGVAPASLKWNPLPGDREPAASKPIFNRPALALPPP